eukprot:g930.t1
MAVFRELRPDELRPPLRPPTFDADSCEHDFALHSHHVHKILFYVCTRCYTQHFVEKRTAAEIAQVLPTD